MSKKRDTNSLRKYISRGLDPRGINHINDNGKDAVNKAKKSTRGHYKVDFVHTFSNMSEKDIELKKTYAKDLISESIRVAPDMIQLTNKRSNVKQTLTALDEVYYVKVGGNTVGKISIRVQRLIRKNTLTFIFQKKASRISKKRGAYTRNETYNKTSKSVIKDRNRRSMRDKNKPKKSN